MKRPVWLMRGNDGHEYVQAPCTNCLRRLFVVQVGRPQLIETMLCAECEPPKIEQATQAPGELR